MNFMSAKKLERVVNEESIICALVVKEVALENFEEPRKEVRSVLQGFQDVFLKELPNQLPPMHEISTHHRSYTWRSTSKFTPL